MPPSTPIHTISELLKTLKGSGLQLRACSLTPEGGISFEVLPEMAALAPLAPGGKEPETFDDIPIPGWDPALASKDPKRAARQAREAMRAALGGDIPSDMPGDF